MNAHPFESGTRQWNDKLCHRHVFCCIHALNRVQQRNVVLYRFLECALRISPILPRAC